MEDRLYNEFARSLKEFLQGVAREDLAEAGPPPLPPKKQPLPAGHEADLQTPLAGNWETNNLEQDSATVLRAFSDKLKKKGIDASKLKKLGVGTMGVAYDLGDKVLKVTKDVREAKASAIVAGKNIPNVVQVYDIWKFPDVNWYGLIIEKLTPLSKESNSLLNPWSIPNSLSCSTKLETIGTRPCKCWPSKPLGILPRRLTPNSRTLIQHKVDRA